VYEHFCLPVSAIARAHDPTVIDTMDSVALRKGPRRFCSHRSDRCRALMLACRNSPLWQCCECYNIVCLHFGRHSSIIWTAWWRYSPEDEATKKERKERRVLIGTSRKLAAYNYMSKPTTLNDAGVQAGGCKWRYPKGQSRICYQECGCHL